MIQLRGKLLLLTAFERLADQLASQPKLVVVISELENRNGY